MYRKPSTLSTLPVSVVGYSRQNGVGFFFLVRVTI